MPVTCGSDRGDVVDGDGDCGRGTATVALVLPVMVDIIVAMGGRVRVVRAVVGCD